MACPKCSYNWRESTPTKKGVTGMRITEIKCINHNGPWKGYCTSILVRQPHIDADHLNLAAVHGQQEACDFSLCPSREHVNDGLFLQVREDGPHLPDVDLVDAKELRCIELVVVTHVLNMGAEHVTDGFLCDSGTPGHIRELLAVSLDGDHFRQSLGHVVVRMHHGKGFIEDKTAVPAFIPFSVELQQHPLSMDRSVMKELLLGAVGVEPAHKRRALNAGRRFKLGVNGDAHGVFNVLGAHGRDSFQVQ